MVYPQCARFSVSHMCHGHVYTACRTNHTLWVNCYRDEVPGSAVDIMTPVQLQSANIILRDSTKPNMPHSRAQGANNLQESNLEL